MRVRNNYNECLTNLACSVQKYFGLPTRHQTLSIVDQVLATKKPKNVVLFLLDGVGTNILEHTLPKDSFLRSNLQKSITTVFPTTTAAATTSLRTGLNPVEHGWTGYTEFIEPINKVITLFFSSEKGAEKREACPEFLTVQDQLAVPLMTNEINAKGEDFAIELQSFGDNAYHGFDDLLQRIRQSVAKDKRVFVYAYDDEPDHIMHNQGTDSLELRDALVKRDQGLAQLVKDLGDDTVVIVTADHGHLNVKNVYLTDYPDLLELLQTSTSMDPRAVVFKVKPGCEERFREKFQEHFGDVYNLYDAEDVYHSHLFGDGKEHPFFKAALGDFLGLATKDICIIAPGDHSLRSQHGSDTDDELFIPVIFKS